MKGLNGRLFIDMRDRVREGNDSGEWAAVSDTGSVPNSGNWDLGREPQPSLKVSKDFTLALEKECQTHLLYFFSSPCCNLMVLIKRQKYSSSLHQNA